VAQRELATAAFLALRLQRPLFLEGEPAPARPRSPRALSAQLQRPLIRLHATKGWTGRRRHEWNYARQMLEIKQGLASDQLFRRPS